MCLRRSGARTEILLIQRKNPPYQGAWALPGGFLDRRENALQAAIRELEEETNLKVHKLVEFGSFSDPDRDPRGRTVTIAFFTEISSRHGVAKASDDAKNLQWFNVRRLPRLAFDHTKMIAQGLKRYREMKKR